MRGTATSLYKHHIILNLETTALSPCQVHRVIEIIAGAAESGSTIAESVLVAHNAAFDIHFLRHEFARRKLGLPNRHVCTPETSRLHFPRLIDRTLETIYLHLFPEAGLHRRNHRALDDARMTAKI